MISTCPYCQSNNLRTIRTKQVEKPNWLEITCFRMCRDCKHTWQEQTISALPTQAWEIKREDRK